MFDMKFYLIGILPVQYESVLCLQKKKQNPKNAKFTHFIHSIYLIILACCARGNPRHVINSNSSESNSRLVSFSDPSQVCKCYEHVTGIN